MTSSPVLKKRANKKDVINGVVLLSLLLFVRTPLLENKHMGYNWLSRRTEMGQWLMS